MRVEKFDIRLRPFSYSGGQPGEMTWVSWQRVSRDISRQKQIPRTRTCEQLTQPSTTPPPSLLLESSSSVARQTAAMVYVRQDKLPNLKQYKYSGVDHSLLSRYVLKPFYTNFVIKCFPMSMAPNLITLSGFSFVVVNLLTLLWYNPTLDQDCPPWVYASWAVGLFLYQTFDAVDGSQA